jgi:hypothetical protein
VLGNSALVQASSALRLFRRRLDKQPRTAAIRRATAIAAPMPMPMLAPVEMACFEDAVGKIDVPAGVGDCSVGTDVEASVMDVCVVITTDTTVETCVVVNGTTDTSVVGVVVVNTTTETSVVGVVVVKTTTEVPVIVVVTASVVGGGGGGCSFAGGGAWNV